MGKSRVTGFDKKAMADGMMQSIIAEQNKRLIDYAKAKIIEIGNRVQAFHSKNNMDRTGHLLNSICWGVSYHDKLIASGFYRETPSLKDGRYNGSWTNESHLHEWFSSDIYSMYPVNGRAMAEAFLEKYGKNGKVKGWKVFFAIAAPYWGYWELGFNMKSGGGTPYGKKKPIPKSTRFMQFAVMAEYRDQIRADLKPARTSLSVHYAKYPSVAKLAERAMR